MKLADANFRHSFPWSTLLNQWNWIADIWDILQNIRRIDHNTSLCSKIGSYIQQHIHRSAYIVILINEIEYFCKSTGRSKNTSWIRTLRRKTAWNYWDFHLIYQQKIVSAISQKQLLSTQWETSFFNIVSRRVEHCHISLFWMQFTYEIFNSLWLWLWFDSLWRIRSKRWHAESLNIFIWKTNYNKDTCSHKIDMSHEIFISP